MKLSHYFLFLSMMGFLVTGCSAVQELAETVDKKLIAGAVGKKYSDVTGETSGLTFRVDYGPILTSQKLSDGSVLYIHVFDFESSRSSIMGIFGDVEHSYKINGFKVKDGVVKDWAYGFFAPGTEYTHIFGFVLGYDANAVLEKIKNDYDGLIKTSTGRELSSWR